MKTSWKILLLLLCCGRAQALTDAELGAEYRTLRGAFSRHELAPLQAALQRGVPIAGDAHNAPLVVEASRAVYPPAVALLLQRGAKPDQVQRNMHGALYEVVTAANDEPRKKDALEIVRLLLKAGADPNGTAKTDRPLGLALHKSDDITIALVEAGAAIEPRELFSLVGRAGHERVLKALVAKGTSPDTKDTRGDSLLVHTLRDKALVGHAQALLESKADPNLADGTGIPPLSIACAAGVDASVALLLKHRANPRALDSEKKAALHHAARSGCAPCIRALLAAGADPNVTDTGGQRPLDYASAPEVTEALKGKTATRASTAEKVLTLPANAEVEKVGKVFRGDGGELVTIVAIKASTPPLFLIKFEGFSGGEWNEKVLLHYLVDRGDTQDYRTRGRDHAEWTSLASRGTDWLGFKNLEISVPGVARPVAVFLSLRETQALDATRILAEYKRGR